jgi:DNA-binding CsgD family transcriptional regulator
MIDRHTFLRLRERFRTTGEIDGELYCLLHRLVSVLVFGARLAPAYSPSGRWDRESLEDALHGWIARRLLSTNALLAAFDLAEEPRPFLLSLERNFRHYLENSKERGELDNLISRSGTLLREDEEFREWIPQRRPSDSWWGLGEWESPEPFQGGDSELVSLAYSLGPMPIFRYSQSVERASPVLSTETLREFLRRLFIASGRLLTISHLAVVYRDRFDVGASPEIELREEHSDAVIEEGAPDADSVQAAAAALVAELSPRQLEAIALRAEGKTLEQIAEALGVSRGTADNALRSAAPLIDKHCVDGITRDLMLEKLLDALSIDR